MFVLIFKNAPLTAISSEKNQFLYTHLSHNLWQSKAVTRNSTAEMVQVKSNELLHIFKSRYLHSTWWYYLPLKSEEKNDTH